MFNHGVELKAKAPPSIYRFMFWRLKTMSMVFCASQTHYNMDIMYICDLIKKPTTIYVNATLKEMGAWFPKDRGGGYSNLWSNGEKPNVKRKTHQDVNHLSWRIRSLQVKEVHSWKLWREEEQEKIKLGSTIVNRVSQDFLAILFPFPVKLWLSAS